MTMKALLVEALSPDLSGCRLADVPLPIRAAGEVLVRVHAASLNFPDLLMTQGLYQLKPPLPFIAGLEMAGEVVEADPESGFAPGDRVMGGTKTGMMACYAVVPEGNLSLIPSPVDYAAAAAFGAAYQTAWVALVELGQLQAGQSVLVHGATGGVGLAAVDLALSMGAQVIATSGSASKRAQLERVRNLRAVLPSEGRLRNQIADLTNGALCDLVYDPVGGDAFDESTRCVAFGGKLLVVGFADGRIPQISVNIPLIKGFSVVGVRAGEYGRRFPERQIRIRRNLLALLGEGRITPHVDRILPLREWRVGFEAMADRQIFGKIVFTP